MLEHLNPQPRKPTRVVVIGAAGFVGGAVADRLERDGVAVLRLNRQQVDLCAQDAELRLAKAFEAGDAIVAAAARAPCKGADMLVENMVMARSMVRALAAKPVTHVINISSDAVYADTREALTEASCAAPSTLHGVMHLAREIMFLSELKAPLAILRPTLLYGAADPHNGYGPNRFRRLAMEGKDIVLFGEGEERRDHVYIGDLAELVTRVIYRRSVGVMNVASGAVHSFREIAERVVRLSGRPVTIKGAPRSGPMPHNGYRAFDAAVCQSAFPDFRYTPLDVGLKLAQEAA